MPYAALVREWASRLTQRTPLPGQVANSAGGYVYPVDDWARLERFLVLGSEGGSYYAGERALTRENAAVVERLLAADGPRVVARVVAISEAGRAPKNEPALLALAMASGLGDPTTRAAAHAVLPRVARTGTHLLTFAAYVEGLRGWGRGLRRAVAGWYATSELDRLALQAVKYRQRGGWSQRDLLRLSHPVTAAEDLGRRALLDWVVRGDAMDPALVAHLPDLVEGTRAVQATSSVGEAAALVRRYGLPREALPTELLREPEVWGALLADMPVTAMIRNLGKLSQVGLLVPGSEAARHVAAVLGDTRRLRRARVHPLALLLALVTYGGGRGLKGSLSWAPVPAVVDALDAAFYASFGAVEATGRRRLLALDVSGSMGGSMIAGTALSARTAAAAMALVTLASEGSERTQVVAFSAGGPAAWPSPSPSRYQGHGYTDGLTPLALSPRQRLDDVVKATAALPFGGTDCALPMLYAAERGIEVDSVEVYTDSETWAGAVHPMVALRRYRERTGIPAKLVVVGMVSNGFTIADPEDGGTLDVVGFDAAAPGVIADFVRGPRPEEVGAGS